MKIFIANFLLLLFSSHVMANGPVSISHIQMAREKTAQVVDDSIKLYSIKEKKAVKQVTVSIRGDEYFSFQVCDLVKGKKSQVLLENSLALTSCKIISDTWFVNVGPLLDEINEEFNLDLEASLKNKIDKSDVSTAMAIFSSFPLGLGASLLFGNKGSLLNYSPKLETKIGGAALVFIGLGFAWTAYNMKTKPLPSLETNLQKLTQEYDIQISQEDSSFVYNLLINSLSRTLKKVNDKYTT